MPIYHDIIHDHIPFLSVFWIENDTCCVAFLPQSLTVLLTVHMHLSAQLMTLDGFRMNYMLRRRETKVVQWMTCGKSWLSGSDISDISQIFWQKHVAVSFPRACFVWLPSGSRHWLSVSDRNKPKKYQLEFGITIPTSISTDDTATNDSLLGEVVAVWSMFFSVFPMPSTGTFEASLRQ